MKSPPRHELSRNSAMKKLLLFFVVVAFGPSIPVRAFDSPTLADTPKGIYQRFSKDTITAIKDAKNCIAIPLKGRPPQAKYDKATKKEFMEPVLRWFDARARGGKPFQRLSTKHWLSCS